MSLVTQAVVVNQDSMELTDYLELLEWPGTLGRPDCQVRVVWWAVLVYLECLVRQVRGQLLISLLVIHTVSLMSLVVASSAELS